MLVSVGNIDLIREVDALWTTVFGDLIRQCGRRHLGVSFAIRTDTRAKHDGALKTKTSQLTFRNRKHAMFMLQDASVHASRPDFSKAASYFQ